MHVTQNSALAMTGTETTRFSAGLRCDPPAAAQSRTRRQETIAAEDAAELTPVGIRCTLRCSCDIMVEHLFWAEPILVPDAPGALELDGGDSGEVLYKCASKSEACIAGRKTRFP
jgi:hypothetical protein